MDIANWARIEGAAPRGPWSAFDGAVPSHWDIAVAQEHGIIAALAESEAPLVAANVLIQDQASWPPPYRLSDCSGHSIAIVGLVQMGEIADLHVIDPLSRVAELVQELRDRQVHSIIVLSNLDAEDNNRLAAGIDGIDVILAGGELFLDEPVMIGDTLLVSQGYPGRSVSISWLEFDQSGCLDTYKTERELFVPPS
jgi:2',3'-cyclic-nucleotide 2'-phosphodiesterase (5'-nucleotidase family)